PRTTALSPEKEIVRQRRVVPVRLGAFGQHISEPARAGVLDAFNFMEWKVCPSDKSVAALTLGSFGKIRVEHHGREQRGTPEHGLTETEGSAGALRFLLGVEVVSGKGRKFAGSVLGTR